MTTYDFIAQQLTIQVKRIDDNLSVITDGRGRMLVKHFESVVLWFKARANWAELPEHQLIFVESKSYENLITVKLTLYKLFAWKESFYNQLIISLAEHYHISENNAEVLLCSGRLKKGAQSWAINELEGRFLKYEIEYINNRENTQSILGITKELKIIQ